MPNLGQVLSRHNAKIAKQPDQLEPPPGCNCQGGPAVCPLSGECQVTELVYQATVTRTDTRTTETYTGLTGGTFKIRYNKHMSDFRNIGGKHATTLSTYIWKVKEENIPYEISWKQLTRGRVFNPISRTCQLCLKEKFLIMFSPDGPTLNRRNKLYSTCRHRLKGLLEKVKT